MIDDSAFSDRGFPTSRELCPAIGVFRYHRIHEKDGKGSLQGIDHPLEFLPYTLQYLAFSFFQFFRTQRLLIARLQRDGWLKQNVILGPPDRDLASFQIDSFLETGRRVQNAAVSYLAAKFKRSFPQSYHDLMIMNKKRPLQLPAPVLQELEGYWRCFGERLRQYRDLSQHYAIVSSDCVCFPASNGQIAVSIWLPNNPEVRKPSLLNWGDPKVHAYDFLEQHFLALVTFVNQLLIALISSDEWQDARVMESLIRYPMTLGASTTVGKPVPDEKLQVTALDGLISKYYVKREKDIEPPA